MDEFVLHSYFQDSIRRLEFGSSVLSGVLKGSYKEGNVLNTFQNILHKSAPKLFDSIAEDGGNQVFSAYVEVENINPFMDIFYPSFHQSSPFQIRSSFNSFEKKFKLSVRSDSFKIENVEISKFSANLSLEDSIVTQSVDVADVLVRLHAVVERHTGDRFGYGCPSSRFLDASGIQHLLLL